MPLYLGKRNQKGVAVETTIEILSSDLPILEDPAALSEVLNGKEFLVQDGSKAIGTMPNNGDISTQLDALTMSYVIPKGYHNGNGRIFITTETKTVIPGVSEQEILPDNNNGLLTSVIIKPIEIDYDELAFDITEIIIGNLITTTSVLGQAILGQMILD